jgi:hypothetical protein
MGSGADPEVRLRRRNPELSEEKTGHLVVVVLPRVQQKLFVVPAKDPRNGRCLDELWPGADNR